MLEVTLGREGRDGKMRVQLRGAEFGYQAVRSGRKFGRLVLF